MISFIDYFCNAKRDHHFSERVKGGERMVMKVRANPDKQRMYCKIDYANGYTEIWEGIENQDRVKIEQVFEPNFTSLEAFVSKLRTYLVFS